MQRLKSKSEHLYFRYDQFPYMEKMDIRVTWEQSLQDDRLACMSVDAFTGCGIIVVHPFTFCRMVGEHYGSDAAFDFLKLMMNDHIDNLTEKYFNGKGRVRGDMV